MFYTAKLSNANETEMKIKINCNKAWEFTRDFVAPLVKPFIAALIGGGVVTGLSGCSVLSQRDQEVSTSVWDIGIPGVAVIKQSTISPDNRGEKDNTAIQSNPVSVSPKLK